MGPNLESCALTRGNLRVCGGSNFSSVDRQAPDHRTVQSWDETVSCAVLRMTALRPVIVVRSSVQKPATCREPGNFAARVLVGRRPGSWIAEWMDRRVVRELSLLLVTLPPPNFAPPLILRYFLRYFFDFHRTNFS